jgi:hypothetical protein
MNALASRSSTTFLLGTVVSAMALQVWTLAYSARARVEVGDLRMVRDFLKHESGSADKPESEPTD